MAEVSSDYKKFKFLNGNRDVDEAHVKKIAKSIALFPDLLSARPILVNEKFEIIDGQHRYTACKQLGLPIHYEISAKLTAKDAIALNRNQKNWGIQDFAKSHANEGNAHYKRYLELAEEHPGIAPSTLITYLQGNTQLKQTVLFREGEFEIADEAEAVRYLEQLEDLMELHPGVKLTRVAESFLRIFKGENYDHDRMVKKMQQWGDTQFNPYGNTSDIMRSIESVYNFHQTEKTITRLF